MNISNVSNLIRKAIFNSDIFYDLDIFKEQIYVLFKEKVHNLKTVCVSVYNNSKIKIDEKDVMGKFIKVESIYIYKNEKSSISYYIYGCNNRYLLYTQKEGLPKKLEKEYSKLDEKVFNYIFNNIKSKCQEN